MPTGPGAPAPADIDDFIDALDGLDWLIRLRRAVAAIDPGAAAVLRDRARDHASRVWGCDIGGRRMPKTISADRPGNLLIMAFEWTATPEGLEYWRAMYTRLERRERAIRLARERAGQKEH